VTVLWLSCLLSVSQHGQLSLPSLTIHRRQTAEDVVRDVTYRLCKRLFLAPSSYKGGYVRWWLKTIGTRDKRPLPCAAGCESLLAIGDTALPLVGLATTHH